MHQIQKKTRLNKLIIKSTHKTPTVFDFVESELSKFRNVTDNRKKGKKIRTVENIIDSACIVETNTTSINNSDENTSSVNLDNSIVNDSKKDTTVNVSLDSDD